MRNEAKDKSGLIKEQETLRRRVAELEKKIARYEHTTTNSKGLGQAQTGALFPESEARFRSIVQQSTDGIALTDEKGILIEWNAANERITGLPAAQVLGQPVWVIQYQVASDEFKSENHLEKIKRSIQVFLETGRAPWLNTLQEVTVQRPDGTQRIVQQQVFPIETEAGFMLGSITRDITHLRRTEEARQHSEATLQSILTTVPVGIGMVQDRVIKWVNERFCRMLGYEQEELLERSARMLYETEAEFERVGRVKYPQIHQRNIGAVKTRMVRKDGRPIDINLRSSPIDKTDLSRGVIFTALDISEQTRAESILNQRNMELALLNRASQAFISSLELNEVIATVLEEVRHLLNVVACSVWLTEPGSNDLICRHAFGPGSELVRGWQLKPGQGLAGWVVNHGQPLNVRDTRTDPRHFKKVDKTIGLELRSILSVPLKVKRRVIGALHLADAQPNRFTAEDQALIESLAASAAIAIENARLYKQTRQDAETKTILLQEVNHRVGNNLTAISGMLSLERHHLKQADQSAYQAIMKDLTNRVNGLATVHTLLSASEWKPLPLHNLIRQVIGSSLQMLPLSKQISIQVTPSPVEVTSDQAHNLALVINELATNSVKYAFEGRNSGRIEVTIRVDEEDWVEVKFRDDGPGYSPGVLQHRYGSVGLNLVRSLMCRNLRGDWSIHNDSGAVTTIKFKANSEVKPSHQNYE